MVTDHSDQSPSSKVLTIEDLCARWGISKATIYKWRVQGKGPRGMKLGRYLRFQLEDIESFEKSMMEER